MSVLVLNAEDVARLLPVPEGMRAMEEAFGALARGEAIVPPRTSLVPPDRRGALAWMPARLGTVPVFGLKAIAVFGSSNADTPYPSHQGAVLLFECEHGRPLAVVDAGAITELRTAAVSALATGLLARPDAGDLALLGCGAQAAAHLAALQAVRQIRRVRVWSRTPAHAAAFAARQGPRWGLTVEAVGSPAAAAAGADIICTATAARAPVLRGAWLSAGVHINAVGASVPPYRELDTDAVRAARRFVETREAALADAEDLRIPLAEGAIGEPCATELGELLLGRADGRSSPEEITLFKSVGLGLEDVAAAHRAYTRALELGAGRRIELGALRPQ